MNAKILMVDDHPENLLALEAVLASPALQLIGFRSGEDVLRYGLQKDMQDVAVILLDVQMPGLGGIETAKLLKNREKTKDIPIIFMTAISKSMEHVLQGYHAGSIDYIFKPFYPELLRLKVEAFVKIHEEKKSLEHERKQQYHLLESVVQERTKELMHANKEIGNSQILFKKLFLSSPSLIAIQMLEDLKYIDVNESWVRNTGYSHKDMIDAAGNVLMIVPDLADDQFLQPDRKYTNLKIKYNTKKGDLRDGLMSTEIIEINGTRCLLKVITDITEKVAMEKEMARLGRLNLIGEMAAGIAHEIRNPLTTIRGFLQMLKKNQTMTVDKIDIMLEELNRANSIITEYLSLAKNKSSDLRSVELNGIIETLFPLIQAEALLSGHNVNVNYGEIPMLMLDEKEIRQLILNICINGLEAMQMAGNLTISTYRDGADIVLRIEDQGCGIKGENMDKLGTPFFTTKDDGTGLGLAICYSIAARHNATIDVISGRSGTIFLIKFKRNSLIEPTFPISSTISANR